MEVQLHPEAVKEFERLPGREREAMANARVKLEALGDQLGFPHSSSVRDAERLRELRPRTGRSPWRAFYRRIGEAMVIGAIGPEATVDPNGFQRTVRAALERLAALEAERGQT